MSMRPEPVLVLTPWLNASLVSESRCTPTPSITHSSRFSVTPTVCVPAVVLKRNSDFWSGSNASA